MATAEEYDLEGLVDGLTKQDLYIPEKICTSSKCEYYLNKIFIYHLNND